jgi:hypothetical protein
LCWTKIANGIIDLCQNRICTALTFEEASFTTAAYEICAANGGPQLIIKWRF